MTARCFLCFAIILTVFTFTHQAAIGMPDGVAYDSPMEGLHPAERNLDTVDYDVLDEEDTPADALDGHGHRAQRSQMGSAMSSGMQTGGTAVDKFGGGLASWSGSVQNFGQGWTNMGQSLQTVDEKIG